MEQLLLDYTLAHIDDEPPLLRQLNRESHLHTINGRMCSGHLQGRLLKMLTRVTKARRVLELGTFTGYSALCFAEGLPDDGEVITIDHNDELRDVARHYFDRSPVGNKVRQVTDDAIQYLERLNQDAEQAEAFDIIFIDADKREYRRYYELSLPLLKQGGLILADNVLWDGHVVETNVKRQDKQTLELQAFNDNVKADTRVEVVILPERDGLSLIVKK